MGFSILPRNRLCSIIIPGSGYRASFPGSAQGSACSIIISWSRLGFRTLSPCSFGILLHHHFLVPARVPGLVSLLFWYPVTSSFLGSGSGSGACLTTLLVSCSIISWFQLGYRGLFHGILFHHPFLVPARVPGFVSHTLSASCSIILSWFRLGFRGLSPYFFGILFHHHFLVPAIGFRGLSPYSFGILFHHPFLVPARVPPVPSSFPGPG